METTHSAVLKISLERGRSPKKRNIELFSKHDYPKRNDVEATAIPLIRLG
jgi:hypothetical protein